MYSKDIFLGVMLALRNSNSLRIWLNVARRSETGRE